MLRALLLVIASALAVAACVPYPLRARAAGALDCPEDKVDYTRKADHVVVARGCGRSITYVCDRDYNVCTGD
jgi:hypothetical protein